MRRARNRARSRILGFTLLEILVVVAIIGIAALVGFPALQNFIARSKIDGMVRSTTTLMYRSRSAAVKQGAQSLLTVDTAAYKVSAFVDLDGDLTFSAGDEDLGPIDLPAGVDFASPDGNIVQFTTIGGKEVAVFEPDGSIETPGHVKFGDTRGNYLQLEVTTQATARIEIRKWDGAAWRLQGEEGSTWEWN